MNVDSVHTSLTPNQDTEHFYFAGKFPKTQEINSKLYNQEKMRASVHKKSGVRILYKHYS